MGYSSSTPLIGVTAQRQYTTGYSNISIPEAHISALTRAGACPLIIPLGLSPELLDKTIALLDGLLFTGGGDIHPDIYDSQMHPMVDEVDRDRDRVELHLLERALEIKLPILGICRGFQLINVGLGGSLYEHILDQYPGALQHQNYPDWPRDHLAHKITVEADNLLANIVHQRELEVNSLHHQGIKNLAPRLITTALASDGILEAFELQDYPFGIAVQWHPEWLPDRPESASLFEAFIRACKQENDQVTL